MTLPGTISLRIDLETANDDKICNLIPFVRLERLALRNSSHILGANKTVGKNESPFPLTSKRNGRRGHETKSHALLSDHVLPDNGTVTKNNHSRQSPSPTPVKKNGRRRQEAKPVLETVQPLVDNETTRKTDPIRQSSSPPILKRNGRRGQETKSPVFQTTHSPDDNEIVMTRESPPPSPIKRNGRREEETKTPVLQNAHLPVDDKAVMGSKPSSSQRRYGTRGQETKVLDKRPFKCTLCMERFHTSVLLAVHMRIHDKESDEEDVDDVDPFDDPDVESDSTCEEIESNVPPKSNSLSKEHENLLPNVHSRLLTSDKDSNSNSKTFTNTDEDSVSSLISSGSLPSPMSNKLPPKRRGPIKLIKCKECPASFSRQWYLDIHLILLHYIHKKNASLKCSGCPSIFVNESHLRQHIETSHSMDLGIMNNEISSALGLTTDALTGEHIKHQKKKGPNPIPSFEDSYPVRRPFHTSIPNNLPSDWHMASSFEKDQLIELLEAELKYIALERNRMGDHFSYSDIQRLSLQICEYLQISNFFDGNPPKRWAQRVLIKVRQIPRPGRFRFVHNVNASYLNAVSELSNRGLSENKIFYAFEARICDVKKNGIAKRVPKTPIGATSPDVSVEDTICTVLCTNANGSVVLQPTTIFRNQIIDIKSLHKLKALKTTQPSRDFLENDYFHEWFAQFLLAIPPARPILLLVEGCVAQLSFRIIMMARENDVHVLFVPSRKRFVHSHQLIRESLLVPLMKEFDKEVVKHLETHNLSSLTVKDFSKVFEPAWKEALPGAETRKSFIQSGFLPLPNSTAPLEVAARDYLNEVIAVGKGSKSRSAVRASTLPKNSYQDKSTSGANPLATSVDTDLSCDSSETGETPPPTPTPETIKEEPVDNDPCDEITHIPMLNEIKEEPTESEPGIPSLDDVKQEVVDLPSSSQTVPQLEVVKFEADEHDCSTCNRSFASLTDLSSHRCNVSSAKLPRENSVGNSADGGCDYHTCPHCKMTFALKESLVFHINTNHTSQASTGKSASKQASTSQKAFIMNKLVKVGEPNRSSAPVQTALKRKATEKEGPDCDAPRPKAKKVAWFTNTTPSSPCDSGTESNSSTSSRTLTASPESLYEHDYSAITTKQLPPPPLPEHDYLGQIYQKPQKPTRSNEIMKRRILNHTLIQEDDTSSPVQKVLVALKAPSKRNIHIHAESLSKNVDKWME